MDQLRSTMRREENPLDLDGDGVTSNTEMLSAFDQVLLLGTAASLAARKQVHKNEKEVARLRFILNK